MRAFFLALVLVISFAVDAQAADSIIMGYAKEDCDGDLIISIVPVPFNRKVSPEEEKNIEKVIERCAKEAERMADLNKDARMSSSEQNYYKGLYAKGCVERLLR